MIRKRWLAPAIVTVALLTAGCATGTSGGGDAGGSGAGSADAAQALGSADNAEKMSALYEKAQKNGENQVISYGPGEQLYGPVYKVFMKRYPKIRVVGQNIFGAELDTRLTQEFASGKHVGSVQTGGAPITLLTSGKDRCQPYTPFTSTYLDDSLIAKDNSYRAVVGWPYGIEYNTDKLSKDEVPTSWRDFTKPEWKGKFVMQDPTRVSGTANTLARMLYDGSYDKQFVKDLAAQNPLIIADSAQVDQAVATGQRPLNFVGQYMQALQDQDKGLPVGFVFPTEDGAALEYHYTCMLKDAPNPNATKLFVNWLFTPEGQKAMSTIGVYGTRERAQPEGLPALSKVEPMLLKDIPRDQQSQVTKDFLAFSKTVFG